MAGDGLGLLDSHAHLTDPKLPGSVPQVLARAREAGVERVLCVGTHPPDWEDVVNLAEAHPQVYAVLGLHPNYSRVEVDWLGRLRVLQGHPRVVAVGEIGLDRYREHSPPEVQEEAFRAQLELALELGRPVVLHMRQAFAEVAGTLEALGVRRGVFHSFSGTLEEAERALALGFHLSFSGPLTFAGELRQVAAALPPERVLVETDSPYLSPHPWRGRPNEPARVRRVAEVLAEARRETLEEVARSTTANAQALFGLPPA